jgi:putative CocE/NonD family hydrolase
MFAVVGGADFFDEYGHPGGATNLGWPMWLARSAQTSPQAAQKAEAAERLNEILKSPIEWMRLHPKERAAAFREFPLHQKAYLDLYAHESKDDYWKQRGWYTNGYHKEMKDVPILFITGWYDYFSKGSLENYIGLSKIQKTTKKLVVGPWPHGIGRSECGDAFFGDSAAVDQSALMLDWFDHWMKGSEFRMVSSAPARLFRMGGGSGEWTASGALNHGGVWRDAGGWPHPQAKPMRLHLDSGRLSEMAPAEKGQAAYVFDPENPVPTIGGRYGPCAQDQVCSPKYRGCDNSLPLDDRDDVLSFATEPLKEAIDVTGKVRARLWVSSDAKDTDFTAKLIDVYPNGYAMIIADGLIRMRFRDGFEKAKLMKPGEVYEATIDLGSTSNLFALGHRIRLEISSSNFPQNEPNPNTGEPINGWTKKVKARNTVYFDKTRASHVELPVVPAK